MEQVSTVEAVRRRLGSWSGRSIGLVPTMGYLHEGHLSLVRRAREENDRVAATIFVNPAQFGEGEDLDCYPRDPEGDRGKLEEAGVDILFSPLPEEIYPPGFQTYVTVENVSGPLCGRTRPGHFRGVATVVTKLLNIFRPDRAYFGSKDFQQTVVIRRLVADLDIDCEVVVCPTVREPDGLAMSSRNVYLNPDERRAATVLYRALLEVKKMAEGEPAEAGPVETDPVRLSEKLRAIIEEEPLARVEYAEVLDPETLTAPGHSRGPLLCALAVRFGTTRLIDNMIVNPPR